MIYFLPSYPLKVFVKDEKNFYTVSSFFSWKAIVCLNLGEGKPLNLKDEYIQECFLSGPCWKTLKR